jgi:cytochrome c-type biogenesis protein CcmH
MPLRALLLLFALFIPIHTLALTLDEPLSDPSLESRARAYFHTIRCMVCTGETIADSPAEVAGDLRREIRKQFSEGKNEPEISALLVQRYGEAILMKPPFNPATTMLWLGPLLVLMAGLWLARRTLRKVN